MTPRDNRVTRRAMPASRAPRTGEPHDTREARGMLRVLPQLGFDLEALLAAAGLHRRDVEEEEAVIAPAACAAVFAAAGKERRVPNLALQLALRTPVGATPLLDYLVVSAESVGEGLRRLARYLRLVNRSVRLVVDEASSPVRVLVERATGPFETELTVALSVVRLKRETGEELRPLYVSFTHEPDDVAGYASALGC